jgi:hypothetical protein
MRGSGARGWCPFAARVVAVLLVVAFAATTAAACGSSGQLPAYASPSATAASIKVHEIEDKTYGFRMAYPVGWVGTRYQNPDPGGAEGTLQYVAAFADPKGAQGNGSYLDSVQVAVYQLERPLTPDALTPATARRLIYKVILRDMESMSPRSDVKPVKVHGVPAWHVGYQFSAGGEVVNANSTLIVKGEYAYWATAQGGAYTWRTVSPTLATCDQHFEVL